jgi:protein-tyrosine-phosphatase
MAEAFARMTGVSEAHSAGSRPSGKINAKAVAAMKEIGYDLTQHHSKSLNQVKQFAPFDVVVTMGCGDACPWMPAKKFIDWEIPDPKDMDQNNFRMVRDMIKTKVNDLVASL